MANDRSDYDLKRGELDVVILELTREELEAVPADQRSFYLFLGQLFNEVSMLQSLLFRSMKGTRGPRPVQETGLGMTLFLTRAICGRAWEAYSVINSRSNGKLLGALWDALPDDPRAQHLRANAEAARSRLNTQLGSGRSLMRLVRNKLAYHLDQDVLDAAFLSIPSNYQLADFHTGLRGTTFFGVADTAAAAAVAQLIGTTDIEAAAAEMIEAATAAIGNLQDFADGYLVAFYLAHFGIERLNAASSVRLRGLPEVETASLGFYMASKTQRRGAKLR